MVGKEGPTWPASNPFSSDLFVNPGRPDVALGTYLEAFLWRYMLGSDVLGLGHNAVNADSVAGTCLGKLSEDPRIRERKSGRCRYTMLLVFFQLSFLIPRNSKGKLHCWFVILRLRHNTVLDCRYIILTSLVQTHPGSMFPF